MNFTDLLGLVLELVSPVVVTEKLEFARRTRGGSVLARGCCRPEDRAWGGKVQTLSSNTSMARGETSDGAAGLPLPLPFGGARRGRSSCPLEVTAGCKICQQLAVTKIERGNANVDRLPQKGGDETFPFRFPFR